MEVLIERLRQHLPDLGKRLAVGSKALVSHGKPRGKRTASSRPDGRRDLDADWGMKTYKGTDKNGMVWEKIKRWFGYKLHLVVDAKYEVPLAYTVTRASANDSPQLLPMIENLRQRHPELVERAEYLSADKAYDSEENNKTLWDEYAIRPVIDIRHTWKEEPGQPRPLYPDRVDTIFYTEQGQVLCRCRDNGQQERDNYTSMAREGFEAGRMGLKYRCPAKARGIVCTQQAFCNRGRQPEHGRIVRVPLGMNRRVFTPLARDTRAWTREYRYRTAVERVNSRFQLNFGFERHYIRGLNKTRLRAGLALMVMLGMAVGWIESGKPGQLRSLVGRARAA